jgi:predicted small secreted protein
MKIGILIGVGIGVAAGILAFLHFGRRKLSYAEVMKGFTEKKNTNPAIVKGSLIKEGEKGHYVITQAFLDNEGNVVDGWKLNAFSLDDELAALFEKNNVVIVE